MIGVLLPSTMASRFFGLAKVACARQCFDSTRFFAHFIHTHPVHVAVVNPLIQGFESAIQIADLIAGYPSIKFIGYFPLTPAAFEAMVTTSRAGLKHALVFGYENQLGEMGALLSAEPIPVFESVADLVRPCEARMPHSVRTILGNMLQNAGEIMSITRLTSEQGISLSQVYRAFRSAGLRPPNEILMCGKLLRAYTYLKDPRSSIAGVATKVGYAGRRSLHAHCLQVFGLPPSRLQLLEESAIRDSVLPHIFL